MKFLLLSRRELLNKSSFSTWLYSLLYLDGVLICVYLYIYYVNITELFTVTSKTFILHLQFIVI